MPNTSPYQLRDFRKGVYRKSSVNSILVPENSVSHSINVNYDSIIGNGVVRSGTTKVGNTVASGKIPTGLYNFVSSGGSTNILLSVYPTAGAGTGTIFYYDTSWHTSGTTTLNNTAKNRFAQLGNRVFRVNGVDAMTSSADGNTWATTDCITTDSVIPSLIYRTQGRLLASGYSGFRDRVYFSSIIDPNASPFITWDTNPSTGDFIDINPDDGGNVTGFSEASGYVLVFKNTGMYRLSVIDKTVNPNNIFNIGAVSQESIVNCQGVTYYFSGQDIRRTNGDYPEQISRLGVQDFIDAIPQSNWSSVSSGTDGVNVYFFIGNITIGTNTDDQKTYSNVVLKFSTRDESWSIHSYADNFNFFTQFTTTSGKTLVGADNSGDVQTINSGYTDNGTPIYFELQTQELEFGNRAHTKAISDDIVVFTNNGIDSKIQVRVDDGNFEDIPIDLSKKVSSGKDINIEARYITVKWFGDSEGKSPVFEGFYIEKIKDKGSIF